MLVAVVTKGRIGRQVTLDSIGRNWQAISLFCPADEVAFHQDQYPHVEVVAQERDDMTISEKRPWVLNWARDCGVEKMLMLDDDLSFFDRYTNDQGKPRLHPTSPASMIHWFNQLEQRLSPVMPHAGFGPRQGNHTQPPGWVSPARMMLALGYHVPTVLDNAQWGRVRTREDMDITLQLLRRGFPNAVTHEFVVDQAGYGSEGGCSDERTVRSSDEDAYVLRELHPGFVRVVDRTYKNVPRKEVVCQWRKALASGTQRRAPDPG